VQDMAEERAQVANANYIAARHWEALVESRRLCAQVSYQSGSCVSSWSRFPRFHPLTNF